MNEQASSPTARQAPGGEDLYRRAAAALSCARRDHVFEDLIRALVELLEVDAAFIGVRGEGEAHETMRTWSFFLDGRWIHDLEYPLVGSACETVLSGGFRYYPQGLPARFPGCGIDAMGIEGYAGMPMHAENGEPLGVVAVMSHAPLKSPARVESILELFATRVAVEVERARTAAALDASNERYGEVFRASLDGLAMLKADGTIVDVNAAMLALCGYPPAALVGRPVAMLVAEPADAALANGEGLGVQRAREGELRRHDGATVPVEWRATRVEFGGEVHVLQIVRDISDRRLAEQERLALEAQLRHAQRMEAIGQLTGGIAHDFNNILTGLLGYLDMARERAGAGDEKLARYLERAARAGGRARGLVQQMLTFSRGSRGEVRPVDLAAVARETIALLGATLPSSIEITTQLPEHAPLIALDPIHFEQVLMNLCINARDAMGGSGRLRVELKERNAGWLCCASCRKPVVGDFIQLSISDNGPGIPEDVAAHIFEPFFSTKEAGKGTGMGLAMVHGIVHEYGGHLLLETGVGEGTTLRVLLPKPEAAAVAADAAPLRLPETAAPSVLHGRVLLVDDDVEVGEFVQELLGDWGLEVQAWRDSAAAAAHVEANPGCCDLALLDQTMPRLTGLDLARRLRARAPDLPVVLYTGVSEDLAEPAVKAAGVDALLRKPLDKALLRRTLEALLARAADRKGEHA